MVSELVSRQCTLCVCVLGCLPNAWNTKVTLHQLLRIIIEMWFYLYSQNRFRTIYVIIFCPMVRKPDCPHQGSEGFSKCWNWQWEPRFLLVWTSMWDLVFQTVIPSGRRSEKGDGGPNLILITPRSRYVNDLWTFQNQRPTPSTLAQTKRENNGELKASKEKQWKTKGKQGNCKLKRGDANIHGPKLEDWQFLSLVSAKKLRILPLTPCKKPKGPSLSKNTTVMMLRPCPLECQGVLSSNVVQLCWICENFGAAQNYIS